MTPLPRVVRAETLDGLAEDDPRAMRSRRDLRRVHRIMGTCSILSRNLRACSLPGAGPAPLRMLELGAGDGSLMLRVAGALAARWPRVELSLLDRQALVGSDTLRGYARLGWTATPLRIDVLDWVAAGPAAAYGGDATRRWDLIVANLFLHHFQGRQLRELMLAVAERCDHFLACEPRRSRFALAASHLIGAIGANAVTREDAVSSVHAGFRDRDIHALWPAGEGRWSTREGPAGAFSHCFSAARTGAA
jgi:hypothetical protein